MFNVLRNFLILALPSFQSISRHRPCLLGGLHNPILPLLARSGLSPECVRNPDDHCFAEEHVRDGSHTEAKAEAGGGKI